MQHNEQHDRDGELITWRGDETITEALDLAMQLWKRGRQAIAEERRQLDMLTSVLERGRWGDIEECIYWIGYYQQQANSLLGRATSIMRVVADVWRDEYARALRDERYEALVALRDALRKAWRDAQMGAGNGTGT